ncbi:MAG TPA: hypothetical protein VK492_00325 [Chitinophagaceae bacterium]|nr:hypothetical protein [Chitinophagaceae bacterium]
MKKQIIQFNLAVTLTLAFLYPIFFVDNKINASKQILTNDLLFIRNYYNVY